MMKWEYMREFTAHLDRGKGGWGGEQDWSDLGEAGWELAAVYVPASPPSPLCSMGPVAIFKRPITKKKRRTR